MNDCEELPVEEFEELVRMGVLTPEDGLGLWATINAKGTFSEGCAFSSPRPLWATHVLWYNK